MWEYSVSLYSIIYTDETAPGPCVLDITGLFKDYTTTSVVEATPDFLEIPHEHANDKQQHGGQQTDDSGVECKEGARVRRCSGGNARKFIIELFPLQLKTFVITLQ